MEIYKVTDLTTGKIYVGQTTRTAEERFREHIQADSLIGRAIRSHGVENFKLEVLEKCGTIEQLNEREPYWIAFFDCLAPKGLNLDSGGHNASPSDIVREKISETLKRYYEEHPEALEQISKDQKKRFADPVEIAKASARTTTYFEDAEARKCHGEIQRRRFEDQAERDKVAEGVRKYFSDPAVRRAQSDRIKAYFETPGAREKNSAAQKKRFEDPAERQKQSELMKKYYAEHPISEETRAKQSAGIKAYWARVRAEREKARAAVEINLFE